MTCTELPLSHFLNDYESELGEWIIAIFAIVAAGLLFYHMTNAKTLPMRATHAAGLSIILLFIATFCCIVALCNFYERTGILLAEKESECAKKIIRKSRTIYTIIATLICITLILIILQIIYNTYTLF